CRAVFSCDARYHKGSQIHSLLHTGDRTQLTLDQNNRLARCHSVVIVEAVHRACNREDFGSILFDARQPAYNKFPELFAHVPWDENAFIEIYEPPSRVQSPQFWFLRIPASTAISAGNIAQSFIENSIIRDS